MAKLIKKVYAQALFDTGIKKGTLDTLYDEVLAVSKAIGDEPEFIDFLGNPGIGSGEKQAAVKRIFEGFLSEDMLGFIETMVEKGRHKEIPDIFDYFISLVKEYKHIGVVYVTTPLELSKEEKQMITDRILKTTDYLTLEMNYSVDESLIGGMTIRINDRICDSSIKSKLAGMEKSLYDVMLT